MDGFHNFFHWIFHIECTIYEIMNPGADFHHFQHQQFTCSQTSVLLLLLLLLVVSDCPKRVFS